MSFREVVLRVRDLETVAAFYRDLLGFHAVLEEAGRIGFSANGQLPPLFILEHDPKAPPRPPRSSGLFHAAILYPDRGALGRIAQKLLLEKIHFASGDHGVSEAFYLDDPEGNGIELYADRPPAVWPKPSGAGDTVGMYTEAVDIDTVIRAGLDQPGPIMPSTTRLGHVHLSVAELPNTERFYHQLLGFDVTVRTFPGALFLGRDGYHHHLGTNVWRSRTPVAQGALGLKRFTLHLTQAEDFARAASALSAQTGNSQNSIAVHDPSGIEIVLTN